MKSKSEKILVIFAITILLITLGIVVPIIAKGDSNSAQKAQVLSGKIFTSDVAGVAVQGAMTNYGDAVFQNPVDAEGEDYIATIDLDDGYYESVQINAKPIYDKGVAAGATTHTGTYTFPANDTGGTKDLGVNHNYRKVNATNVYNKGKADGALSGSFTKLYDSGLVENNASFSYKFSSGVKDAIIILSSISNYTYDGAQPAISVPSGTVTILDWASERAQDTNNTFRSYIKVYYLKDAGGKTVSGKVHYRGRVYIGRLT